VIAEVMTKGAVEYDFFNFQANSETKNHARIRSDLQRIIGLRDPQAEEYRINITDVVRGGYGINKLVAFLGEIKCGSRYANQKWVLDLNLVHDDSPNTDLSRILSVQRLGVPDKFEINLHRYTVPNLIVEDYDEALAVELFTDGQRHRFKPCAVPGRFLYRVGDDVRLIETDDSYKTFENLYSKAITETLIYSSAYKQAGVVWNEYQNK